MRNIYEFAFRITENRRKVGAFVFCFAGFWVSGRLAPILPPFEFKVPLQLFAIYFWASVFVRRFHDAMKTAQS